MRNLEVARLFNLMADVLLRDGNVFRIRAYRRAAQNLEWLARLTRLPADALARAPGIGAAIADSVVKSFADRVLTGALTGPPRDDATAQIEARGGRVTESVSRATDYVVVGEAPGRKLEQARRLGVRTLDEAQRQRLLAHGGAA